MWTVLHWAMFVIQDVYPLQAQLCFMASVNSTNITLYIYLNCHFAIFHPGSTSTKLSHTRLHLTDGLVWRKVRPCVDSVSYLYVYWISTFYILLLRKGDLGSCLSFYYNVRQIRNLNGAQCGAVGWAAVFQAKISPVRIPLGLLEIFIDCFFQPHCGPGVDANFNTNECQGCLVQDKGDCT